MRVDQFAQAGGEARALGRDSGSHRRVQREDLILLGLLDEHLAHRLDLLRMLRGDVLGLVEVPGQVVELEHLVVERVRVGGTERVPRHAVDLGAQQPAVVIERPLAHHLEVLRIVPGWRLGIRGVERIGEAGALDGFLLDAVHVFRRGDAGDLEQRGHDVYVVNELLAQGALVRVAADEAVEVVEAHAGRPLGERPDLAGLVGRRVVVLAEPARRVAVVAQNASDRRIVQADDAVVAGETGGLLGNHTETDRVMVASGDQRGACRRAQRGGEHPVVAQPVGRDMVQLGVGMTPPNVLGMAKPASSVMISRKLGAPFGGTTRGGHQGLDSSASSLITPPNSGAGGGS